MKLRGDKEHCTCCDKRLYVEPVWLELDQRNNTYHDFGVPVEYSQGCFPFGKTCAKKKIVEAKKTWERTI